MKTPVSTLLKGKAALIVSISPTATAYDAMKLMGEKSVGSILVQDAQGKVIGIISERDCLRKVVILDKDPHKTRASEIMTAKLVTVPPERTVEECMTLMTENRIRHLPVMEGGKCHGVISIGDCVKYMVTEQDQMIQNLEKYIEGSL